MQIVAKHQVPPTSVTSHVKLYTQTFCENIWHARKIVAIAARLPVFFEAANIPDLQEKKGTGCYYYKAL